ncbi:MAG: PAS domain-containing protein [Candidatus Woesearchaeota archaeon]|nr:PAS domain-containing protein [Candidatus Woesearchaeota archaeon]
MEKNTSAMTKFNNLVLEEKATWWQMDLPSGSVIFGNAKSKMLGYSESKFRHYTDFTDLVHPADHNKVMAAMKDHLSGKKKFYESTYRIRNKTGEYLTFYDCGQITNKSGENITLLGFVIKLDESGNIQEQMDFFKDIIIRGDPSILELVSNLKK